MAERRVASTNSRGAVLGFRRQPRVLPRGGPGVVVNKVGPAVRRVPLLPARGQRAEVRPVRVDRPRHPNMPCTETAPNRVSAAHATLLKRRLAARARTPLAAPPLGAPGARRRRPGPAPGSAGPCAGRSTWWCACCGPQNRRGRSSPRVVLATRRTRPRATASRQRARPHRSAAAAVALSLPQPGGSGRSAACDMALVMAAVAAWRQHPRKPR